MVALQPISAAPEYVSPEQHSERQQSTSSFAAGTPVLRFHVANLTCGGCARAVESALRAGGTPSGLQFDLAAREVRIDASERDAAAIAARLMQDGWQAGRRPG